MVTTRNINSIEMHPRNASLKDSGYSLAEQADIYNKQLIHIIENPRLYLDNLRYLREYRVSWKDYRSTNPTIPYEYTNRGKDL